MLLVARMYWPSGVKGAQAKPRQSLPPFPYGVFGFGKSERTVRLPAESTFEMPAFVLQVEFEVANLVPPADIEWQTGQPLSTAKAFAAAMSPPGSSFMILEPPPYCV